MELYKGQLKDIKFNKSVKYNSRKKSKKITYEDIFTFDIEVSSGFINEHGNVIKYKKGLPDSYWNDDVIPISLCYIWQFSYNYNVYYGRELVDFLEVLRDLPTDGKIYIWVHNLSYETHFLLNILSGVEFFARSPHKPMYMRSQEFPNIEFRCSYYLTRLSLANWGLQIGLPKLVGDLDYRKIRTPYTKLTKTEMDYCERDCLVVYNGILKYIEKYGSQDKIPLTQTGTVRQVVKEKLLNSSKYYLKRLKKMVPRDAEQYQMLRDVFAGGYTHANRAHAGIVQGEGVHYDFTSHYPTMMVAKKYPMSAWYYIGRRAPDPAKFEDYAYIMRVKFRNIRCIKCNTYIQISKCVLKHFKGDNGRLIYAEECELYLTEQDFLIIEKMYEWEGDPTYIEVYEAKKDYLPTVFIEYILELFCNKTVYDGVEGFEDLYLWSKQLLNSLFGMSVTALVQSDVTFDEKQLEWGIDDLTTEQVNQKLEDLRRWFPWENHYFLNYSWGVYITAYARKSLFDCILYGDNDYNTLYADTDSIFILGSPSFKWYNQRIVEELTTALQYHDIDISKMRPQKPNGKYKQLGLFTREPDFTEFITLGAKRYCERRKDGKLYLTISGINKEAVYCLKNDINNFKDGMVFDKDFPTVHKNLIHYNMNQPVIRWPDGYISAYKCGINMRPTGYTMSVNKSYQDILKEMNSIDGDQLEMYNHYLRGKFK